MQESQNKETSSGKKRKNVVVIFVFVSILTLVFAVSFAVILRTITGTKNYVLVSTDLKLYLNEDANLAETIEENIKIPVSDFQGKETTGYLFSLVNDGNVPADYSIYLDEDEGNTMPIYALRYNLAESESKLDLVGNISDLKVVDGARVLHTSTILAHNTQNYELKIWLGLQAENDAKNKTYSVKIRVAASETVTTYYDRNLNGCDPVLSSNLVPVTIADDGTVQYADVHESWYNYKKQQWANAVVLEDTAREYTAGDVIDSTDIESYFVWIPRYKYKIFNDESYTSVTGLSDTAVQTIEVVFEDKSTPISSGTAKDEWLSHPAFQAFDSNGFWVGKFETGYRGATTTAAAQVNSSDYSKIIVRPNEFSWRSITLGNAFKASYEYLRSDESHMMKNTEWGAVAYLQHSIYGSRESVRVNNNSSYKTGYSAVTEPTLGYSSTSISGNQFGTAESVTLPYNTPIGYAASTTGNISGIYDMSGGAHEYVMGYNQNASSVGGNSGITGIYGDFFSNSRWDKYYDRYTSSSDTAYNNQILGDATGEMGPFGNVKDPDGTTRPRTSWYGGYAFFTTSAYPWFYRGGDWHDGVEAGAFNFSHHTGGAYASVSFRLVLTP